MVKSAFATKDEIPAVLLLAITSCAESPPDLPASTEPAVVHDLLAGTSEYFTWIAHDADSDHNHVATRAAESAHATQAAGNAATADDRTLGAGRATR